VFDAFAPRVPCKGHPLPIFFVGFSNEFNVNKIEEKELTLKNIELVESNIGRIHILLLLLKKLPRREINYLIISHSLRSTLMLRVIKELFRRKYTINTTLHQVPRLSHTSQRAKRFIYSQFTDNLFCFSKAAELGWYTQFGNRYEGVLFKYSKSISTLRNGVYLDRLPAKQLVNQEKARHRIIYLGRLSFWKGLETIKILAKSDELKEFDFVLMVPAIAQDDLQELERALGNRLSVIQGKSVASFISQKGDVHIYPANYGKDVKLIESISLNCLEMCALGFPSIVTSGGLATWPEFTKSKFIQEVDWSNIEEVEYAIKSLSDVDIPGSEIARVRELVDIKNQVKKLMALA
jgi:glycosyltransferase involved in cell wall biosynthesis